MQSGSLSTLLQTLSPASTLERVMGIEPTPSAWKAEVLPLNYTRFKAFSPGAPVYPANEGSGGVTPHCLVEGEGFEPS
jgi:hypothetical protein